MLAFLASMGGGGFPLPTSDKKANRSKGERERLASLVGDGGQEGKRKEAKREEGKPCHLAFCGALGAGGEDRDQYHSLSSPTDPPPPPSNKNCLVAESEGRERWLDGCLQHCLHG